MNLFEITESIKALKDLLEQGEIDEQIFNDTVEGLGFEEKVDNYRTLIMMWGNENDLIKAEIDRLTALKKRNENNVDRLKDSLLNTFKILEKKEYKTPLYSVKIALNPPKLIVDTGVMPKAYCYDKTEIILDKALLKEALKNGEVVDGCQLVQEERIVIK